MGRARVAGDDPDRPWAVCRHDGSSWRHFIYQPPGSRRRAPSSLPLGVRLQLVGIRKQQATGRQETPHRRPHIALCHQVTRAEVERQDGSVGLSHTAKLFDDCPPRLGRKLECRGVDAPSVLQWAGKAWIIEASRVESPIGVRHGAERPFSRRRDEDGATSGGSIGDGLEERKHAGLHACRLERQAGWVVADSTNKSRREAEP